MLEWNLKNQAEWLIFTSPIFIQVILIWSILLLKTAEQYASHMLLEASLPLGDTGGIELEPVLRSEVLKASHFLVFLSVPTPDSLWPAQFFSTCQTQKRSFTPFPFCTWSPVTMYISWSWWVSQRRLFSCACSLCHFPGLFNPLSGTWSVTLPTICYSPQRTMLPDLTASPVRSGYRSERALR